MDTFFVGADGLDRALRVDPCAVTLVDPQDLGWEWIDFPSVARRSCLLPTAFRLFRGQMIEEAFAVLHYISIQINHRADTIGDSVGDTADHPTCIGMAAENHIGKLFPTNEGLTTSAICGGETDLRRRKVAPFAYAGKCGRKDVVTCGGERLCALVSSTSFRARIREPEHRLPWRKF